MASERTISLFRQILRTHQTPPLVRLCARWTLYSFVASVLASPAVVIYLLASGWFGYQPADHRNLNYEEYTQIAGVSDGFDPVGASEIFYAGNHWGDGFDCFLRLRIDPVAFDSLRRRYSEQMKDTQRAAHFAVPIGQIHVFHDQDESQLKAWPKPQWQPEWWEIPRGESLERIRWELQCVNCGKAWYWVYNRGTGILHVWEWAAQHHVFPAPNHVHHNL